MRLVFLPSILFCSILQIVLTGQFGTRSGPLCLQCEFQCVHSAERYNPVFKAAGEITTWSTFGDEHIARLVVMNLIYYFELNFRLAVLQILSEHARLFLLRFVLAHYIDIDRYSSDAST